MQPGSAPWLTAGPSYETAAGGAAELQIDARLRTPALYQGENASLALVAAGLFRGGRGAYRNGSQVSSSEQAMAGGSSLPAVSEPERHDVLSERVMARGISEAFRVFSLTAGIIRMGSVHFCRVPQRCRFRRAAGDCCCSRRYPTSRSA